MIEKEIDFLIEKLKFYRNVLLAVATGIIIVVYGVLNKKVLMESLYLAGIGVILFLGLMIRIKFLENRVYTLIKEYENEYK